MTLSTRMIKIAPISIAYVLFLITCGFMDEDGFCVCLLTACSFMIINNWLKISNKYIENIYANLIVFALCYLGSFLITAAYALDYSSIEELNDKYIVPIKEYILNGTLAKLLCQRFDRSDMLLDWKSTIVTDAFKEYPLLAVISISHLVITILAIVLFIKSILSNKYREISFEYNFNIFMYSFIIMIILPFVLFVNDLSYKLFIISITFCFLPVFIKGAYEKYIGYKYSITSVLLSFQINIFIFFWPLVIWAWYILFAVFCVVVTLGIIYVFLASASFDNDPDFRDYIPGVGSRKYYASTGRLVTHPIYGELFVTSNGEMVDSNNITQAKIDSSRTTGSCFFDTENTAYFRKYE